MQAKIDENGITRIGEVGKVWATKYASPGDMPTWSVYAFPIIPDGGLIASGLTKAEAEDMIREILNNV